MKYNTLTVRISMQCILKRSLMKKKNIKKKKETLGVKYLRAHYYPNCKNRYIVHTWFKQKVNQMETPPTSRLIKSS